MDFLDTDTARARDSRTRASRLVSVETRETRAFVLGSSSLRRVSRLESRGRRRVDECTRDRLRDEDVLFCIVWSTYFSDIIYV